MMLWPLNTHKRECSATACWYPIRQPVEYNAKKVIGTWVYISYGIRYVFTIFPNPLWNG